MSALPRRFSGPLQPLRTFWTESESRYGVRNPQLLRHARRVAVVLCLAVIIVVSAGGSSSYAAQDQPSTPLPDASLTPTGWSPIGLGLIQISVPSDWLVEDPGYSCGGETQGMVFVNQAPTPSPSGECPLTPNVVELTTGPSTPLPESYRNTVNPITVLERDVQSATDDYAVTVRALGTEVDARGPLASQVVKTLTHSPRSVVLHSSVQSAPQGWRHVTFGGIRFAVPGQWTVDRENTWGGCPGNIAAGLLLLSTATTVSAPSCPGPILTAGYLSASQGMVLGSGPRVERPPTNASCRTRHTLRICIDPPPAPVGGFSPGHQLNLLTAQVHVRGQDSTDQIEIGSREPAQPRHESSTA